MRFTREERFFINAYPHLSIKECCKLAHFEQRAATHNILFNWSPTDTPNRYNCTATLTTSAGVARATAFDVYLPDNYLHNTTERRYTQATLAAELLQNGES